MKILLVIIFLALVLLVTFCALSVAKRADEAFERTRRVAPSDFAVLRVALDREDLPPGAIQWAEIVTMPGGAIWAHGEIAPTPGLVRPFCVRLGHEGERPVLEE